jgi:hypothetical protein
MDVLEFFQKFRGYIAADSWPHGRGASSLSCPALKKNQSQLKIIENNKT